MVQGHAAAVTPGQAQWIVERLIAEGRISAAEVRAILSGMSEEIAALERRLATLRGHATYTPDAPRNARSASASARRGKRAARGRTKTVGHPRGIAGTLAVLLRSIPAAEHAAIAAIRADKGIKAAIAAARTAAKKA